MKNKLLQNIVLLTLYVSLTCLGLYQMKLYSYYDFLFYVAFGFYVASYGVWLLILRLNPLSKAYPIAAGTLIFVTQIVDHFFMGEVLYSVRMIGIVCILAGIFLIHHQVQKKPDVIAG